MFRNKKYLAFIPARGGSKGIPGKNIYEIQGKPLIAYSIEAARNCLYIDDIVVSTDSEKIADVARKYGATVPFLRPDYLAGDEAKTIDCVLDTLARLEESYDALVLLQPTSPLRGAEDISRAIEHYSEIEKDLVSISEVEDNPILIRQTDGEELRPLLSENSTIRRQDMKPYYKVNGAIYINEIAGLTKETSFNDNPAYYIMEKSHSVDIDRYEDIALCEYYLTGQKG